MHVFEGKNWISIFCFPLFSGIAHDVRPAHVLTTQFPSPKPYHTHSALSTVKHALVWPKIKQSTHRFAAKTSARAELAWQHGFPRNGSGENLFLQQAPNFFPKRSFGHTHCHWLFVRSHGAAKHSAKNFPSGPSNLWEVMGAHKTFFRDCLIIGLSDRFPNKAFTSAPASMCGRWKIDKATLTAAPKLFWRVSSFWLLHKV